jgi:hypothetical protein
MKLYKIRNKDIMKKMGVFSMIHRIRRYRQDWLEHVEEAEEGEMPKRGSLVQTLRKKRSC